MTPYRNRTNTAAIEDFQRWFDHAPDAYLILSPDLTISGVNDLYLLLTGASRADIVGRALFEVFPDNPNDPAADGVRNLRASLDKVLTYRVPDAMPTQKYDVRDLNGRWVVRYWSPLNTPILDATGRVQWIIHRVEEVTARVELGLPVTPIELEAYTRRTQAALEDSEHRLRQSQKLEAVGRLAGGVAHDFNNLLTVILASAEFLRSDGAVNERGLADLHEIEGAAQRASDLTRRLLAFSRQQVLDPRVLEPAAVVRGLQSMLARIVGENIEQRYRLEEGAGSIRADWSQIEQVLLNLVVNARDAMPKGGMMSVEVSPVELDEQYAHLHGDIAPGAYVVITVSDTGHGMDRATQMRAFEPFFTTKPTGVGTGLGLSTVYGIARQSGGTVSLYSEPGIGTTVKVYLPRVSEAPVARPSGPVPLRGGKERILVLEDDDAVRNAVLRILTRLGYEATGTGSAAEALVRLATVGREPELLVTDVVMPEMDGRQFAARATALVPGMKVLYFSGYTDDVVLQHGILAEGMAFLSKPVTYESLGRKVREVLDGGAATPGDP